MRILAIDTTTRGGSIAVMRGPTLLSLIRGDDTRTHGERVPSEIAEALRQAGVDKSALDLIAVAAGPGAFTGLRIGLAAAQGLALTLNLPAVGVSALDALAWTAIPEDPPLQPASAPRWIAAWMDAQRGDVFASLYRASDGTTAGSTDLPWTIVDEAITARPLDVLDRWWLRMGPANIAFVGDAVTRDAELIARVGAGHWRTRTLSPLAPAIGQLGRLLASRGQAGKPHALRPIYVRRPDAEIERERKGTR